MKIAYCFGGHLRTFNENALLPLHLIRSNPGDIFIHTYSWRNTPAPLWHGDNTGAQDRVTAADLHLIRCNYPNIRGLLVDDLHGGEERAPPAWQKLCGRYTVGMVHELRCLWERNTGTKYDLVFCARFDLLPMETVTLPMPKPGVLYGSHQKWHEGQPINGDVFAFGTPEVITALALPMWPEKYEKLMGQVGFYGERTMTQMSRDLGFSYEVFPMKHGLLRSGGRVQHVSNEGG